MNPFISSLSLPYPKRQLSSILIFTLILSTFLPKLLLLGKQFLPSIPSPVKSQLVESFGKLPLSFEANQGQTDSQVKFISRGHGYSLFLTPTEAVLALRKAQENKSIQGSYFASGSVNTVNSTSSEPVEEAVVRMQLIGANANPVVSGLDELPGKVTYIKGNDPNSWRTNVSTFEKLKY